MKAQLWDALRSAVRLCPERLRLAFLEQPLAVPMDFGGIRLTAHSSEEYYIRSRSAAKEPDTVAMAVGYAQGCSLCRCGSQHWGIFFNSSAALSTSAYSCN